MNYLEKIPEEAVLKFHINYCDDRWFDTFEWTYFHKVYNIGYVAVDVEPETLVTVEVDGIHYLPINKHPNSDTAKVEGYRVRSRSMSPEIVVNLDAIQTHKITYGWWRINVDIEYEPLRAKPPIYIPRFLAKIEVVE